MTSLIIAFDIYILIGFLVGRVCRPYLPERTTRRGHLALLVMLVCWLPILIISFKKARATQKEKL